MARLAWAIAVPLAVASRAWNALEASVLKGYDAWGHIAYALFLDLYHAIPYADQGWSYFHPPLHYLFGFLLAQVGDTSVLVRGIGLVSSAASLGSAGASAWIVRLALPERPLLAPLAFVAAACVPVHLYTSPMPGNEQTSAFLSTLGFALFVRNELRPDSTRRGDLVAGLVMGLALLAKFSGLLPLAAAVATLAFRALREPSRAALARSARRALLITATALLVCAPYYARNVVTFGTPFKLSRDTAVVSMVENEQPPGSRSWRDLVHLSPRLFAQPLMRSPHLLHSIWGSAYVNAWSDPRYHGNWGPRPAERALLWPGLLPTVLALLGLAISTHRAVRLRDAPVDVALVGLTLVNLGAFVVMAYRVPTFAMLKASYLLQLSLPYGLFLARALDALGQRWRWLARGAAVWIVALATTSAVVYAPGVVRKRGGENARMAAVYLYFGDYPRAREICEESLAAIFSPARRTWISEALAGVLLTSGESEPARALYERMQDDDVGSSPNLEPRDSPWVANRLAVATALAGDPEAARAQLDEVLAREREPELLVNLAALRGWTGDLAGAASALDEGLALDPRLVPAWRNLAWVRARQGDVTGAQEARRQEERLAREAPRGFPYGIGNGFHLSAQRFMLVIEEGGLALYRPARARAQ